MYNSSTAFSSIMIFIFNPNKFFFKEKKNDTCKNENERKNINWIIFWKSLFLKMQKLWHLFSHALQVIRHNLFIKKIRLKVDGNSQETRTCSYCIKSFSFCLLVEFICMTQIRCFRWFKEKIIFEVSHEFNACASNWSWLW